MQPKFSSQLLSWNLGSGGSFVPRWDLGKYIIHLWKWNWKNIHVPVSPESRSVHSLNWKVPPEQACHSPSLTPLRRRLSSVTCTYLHEGTETATIIKMVATAVNTDAAIDRNLVHNFIVFLKEVFRFPQKNWAECNNRIFCQMIKFYILSLFLLQKNWIKINSAKN